MQPNAPGLNAEFTKVREQGDLDQMMKLLNTRINDFIKKMFANSIRASDISYDYIHHMYELYPNHRLHTELITKCLQVLCDISTEDWMHQHFKARQ